MKKFDLGGKKQYIYRAKMLNVHRYENCHQFCKFKCLRDLTYIVYLLLPIIGLFILFVVEMSHENEQASTVIKDMTMTNPLVVEMLCLEKMIIRILKL